MRKARMSGSGPSSCARATVGPSRAAASIDAPILQNAERAMRISSRGDHAPLWWLDAGAGGKVGDTGARGGARLAAAARGGAARLDAPAREHAGAGRDQPGPGRGPRRVP